MIPMELLISIDPVRGTTNVESVDLTVFLMEFIAVWPLLTFPVE
jgi:hypothetical protein